MKINEYQELFFNVFKTEYNAVITFFQFGGWYKVTENVFDPTKKNMTVWYTTHYDGNDGNAAKRAYDRIYSEYLKNSNGQ